jgi:hypothetical protein
MVLGRSPLLIGQKTTGKAMCMQPTVMLRCLSDVSVFLVSSCHSSCLCFSASMSILLEVGRGGKYLNCPPSPPPFTPGTYKPSLARLATQSILFYFARGRSNIRRHVGNTSWVPPLLRLVL